ncbi:MAG TPA: DUF4188 domain-containing protein [Jatrophihabitans sp.]|jgi:hypothetical protein|nr:DUF4188 domain-containing protein [Jatrophihabitans sp.]
MVEKPILGAMTADPDTDVVLFLIGMRINRWRDVRHWLPVFRAMRPMIQEILSNPDSGCLYTRTYFSGRTVLTVQFWNSTEQLMSYAHDAQAKHLPAWRAFNRTAADTGAVGIFHETYPVARGAARTLPIQQGGSETLYRSMPLFGLARATRLRPRRAPQPKALPTCPMAQLGDGRIDLGRQAAPRPATVRPASSQPVTNQPGARPATGQRVPTGQPASRPTGKPGQPNRPPAGPQQPDRRQLERWISMLSNDKEDSFG